MPGKDKTGPLGQGPMTGRSMGPCGGGMRRGFGRCLGRGFGQRTIATVEPTKEEEKKILEAELKQLESEKEAVKKRLSEIA